MSAWGILNRAFRMPSDGQKCPLTALKLSLGVKSLQRFSMLLNRLYFSCC